MATRKRKQPKSANPTTPNPRLEKWYLAQMEDLLLPMEAEVQNVLRKKYKAQEKRIELTVNDASPTASLQEELKSLAKKWINRFEEEAPRIAKEFAERSQSNVKYKLLTSLKEAGFTVKMPNTRQIQDILQAIIYEQVNLITSIPAQYLTEVEGLVMRSVREGRNLSYLTEELIKRRGIDRRRAQIIARDQNNKATESLARARNMQLGITEGVWMHRSGSKQPRSSHVAANGQVFNLELGCKINGRYIFPGQEVNCRCTFKPVLPKPKHSEAV